MVLSMWHNVRNQKDVMKQYAALFEFNKIATENPKLLEEANKPEI